MSLKTQSGRVFLSHSIAYAHLSIFTCSSSTTMPTHGGMDGLSARSADGRNKTRRETCICLHPPPSPPPGRASGLSQPTQAAPTNRCCHLILILRSSYTARLLRPLSHYLFPVPYSAEGFLHCLMHSTTLCPPRRPPPPPPPPSTPRGRIHLDRPTSNLCTVQLLSSFPADRLITPDPLTFGSLENL